MVSKVTNGVKVAVEVIYRPRLSTPKNGEYFFTYRVTIENCSEDKIQLLTRHWHIFDPLKGFSEVKGDGVVGFQPTLLPNDIHQYESACILSSEIGKMHGNYTFTKPSVGKSFKVQIPEFILESHQILN